MLPLYFYILCSDHPSTLFGITDKVAKFDGILGLAFPILSQNPDAKTVLQNLIDQDSSVNQHMFGFFLGDNADGELTVGGYDETKIKGEVTWVDLLMPTCKSKNALLFVRGIVNHFS